MEADEQMSGGAVEGADGRREEELPLAAGRPAAEGTDQGPPKKKAKLPRRSKDSVAFHRDPFNRPEHVHTLRGRELIIFVLLYAVGVVAIVVLFESVMPVIFVDEHVKAEQRRRASVVFNRVALGEREAVVGKYQ